MTQGDILRTPTLETLFEQARENTAISTSISTALDSCCAEIQEKLSDLSALIRNQFRRLRTLVISRSMDLKAQASSNLTTLTDALTEVLNSIQEKADSHYKSVIDTLLDSREMLITLINRRFVTLADLLNQTKTSILEAISASSDRLESLLSTSLSSLKGFIEECFAALLTSIEGLLTTQGAGIIGTLISYYTTRVLPVLAGLATGLSEVIAATSYISSVVGTILTQLKLLPKTLEDLLDAKFEDLKTYLSDWKSDLIKEIAQEVSLQIVGESYYKWDSVSTYYPTITFIFKEKDVSQYARKSQIKLRLSKKNEDLTDSDIKNLRLNCNLIINSTYCYGTQRFNYVSTDKRFKTTIFGDNSSQIKALFTSLFKVINEPFEERNLSITSCRSRVNGTRRKLALGGSEVNDISYTSPFVVKFKKAVLLVNGLKSPIVLAES